MNEFVIKVPDDEILSKENVVIQCPICKEDYLFYDKEIDEQHYLICNNDFCKRKFKLNLLIGDLASIKEVESE